MQGLSQIPSARRAAAVAASIRLQLLKRCICQNGCINCKGTLYVGEILSLESLNALQDSANSTHRATYYDTTGCYANSHFMTRKTVQRECMRGKIKYFRLPHSQTRYIIE